MRCTRCGNENPGQNRFCGMCGATLLAAPAQKAAEPVAVAAPAPSATQVAPAASKASELPRPAAPVTESHSSISGPSFLGLNDPAPSRPTARKRASLSIDPHSAPGSNLEYLLDEEEPPRHWGIGKILFILIALGLAIGFGYLRWKHQGLPFLNASKRPSASTQSTPAPETSPTTSNPAPGSQTSSAPASTGSIQPETTGSANPVTGSAPGTPDSTSATPNPVADASKAADATPPATRSEKVPPEKDVTTAKDTSSDTGPSATAAPEKPKPTAKAPTPKPSPAARPAPSDPVGEARKYLYGRGASQDCERGLRLLKPEANRANPKAMVEMGALYSAGLCTPRDLPTAYRWFAIALRKDPENTAIQTDLQKLWGEMTQPERQLAIKLTQ